MNMNIITLVCGVGVSIATGMVVDDCLDHCDPMVKHVMNAIIFGMVAYFIIRII